ncbi:hypothetical protein V8C42DRAFT_310656 [Trichoderma barbatum]
MIPTPLLVIVGIITTRSNTCIAYPHRCGIRGSYAWLRFHFRCQSPISQGLHQLNEQERGICNQIDCSNMS